MNLYRSVCTVCISTAICFGPAGAQSPVQISPSDPFKIEHGSTFSASTARPGSKPKHLSPPIVAADSVLADISEALAIINRNHVAAADSAALTRSSISSMLRSLDPHSDYFDAAEFSSLIGSHAGEYSGVGTTIANYEQGGKIETYVISTLKGSSADRAGLRFGDRLIAVAGQNVDGRPSSEVRDLIRGKDGTSVAVVVERPGRAERLSVRLQRERLPRPSISNHFTINNGSTGYIALTDGFSNTTEEEFAAAMSDLKGRGITSLVLDLRGNRGGILEAAVKVAERFLPAGRKILTQRGRTPSDDQVWHSGNHAPETMPLVVLVDADSASAAEIVAGALQDNDRAIIVGEKTFGKGLVQNVINLNDGSGITLTAARYYLPSGRSLQRNYSDAALYDYYKQTNRAAAVETSDVRTRTRSGRPVTGGDGIAPDVPVKAMQFTPEHAQLSDPIFFFCVKYLDDPANRRNAEQMLLTGDRRMENEFLFSFTRILDGSEDGIVERNRDFVADQLRYSLTLAIFGPQAAYQVRASSDSAMNIAIAQLPNSQNLAAR